MSEKLSLRLKKAIDYLFNNSGFYCTYTSDLTRLGNLLEPNEKITLKTLYEKVKEIEENSVIKDRHSAISYSFYKDFLDIWQKITERISSQIEEKQNELVKKYNLSEEKKRNHISEINKFEEDTGKNLDLCIDLFSECFGKYLESETVRSLQKNSQKKFTSR